MREILCGISCDPNQGNYLQDITRSNGAVSSATIRICPNFCRAWHNSCSESIVDNSDKTAFSFCESQLSVEQNKALVKVSSSGGCFNGIDRLKYDTCKTKASANVVTLSPLTIGIIVASILSVILLILLGLFWHKICACLCSCSPCCLGNRKNKDGYETMSTHGGNGGASSNSSGDKENLGENEPMIKKDKAKAGLFHSLNLLLLFLILFFLFHLSLFFSLAIPSVKKYGVRKIPLDFRSSLSYLESGKGELE